MRRISVILGIALLAVMLPASAVAAKYDPFSGVWTATDTDGSNLTMYIGASGRHGAHSVFYVDDAAGVCDGAPANAVGSGIVEDSTLYTGLATNCLPGGNVFRSRSYFLTFTYDSNTDTLSDNTGVLWTRA